jgi:GT2 family glycosyltransferase
MTVSVMITTRGRSDDLRRTCRVLQQLSPQPLEVLVTMDGCTTDVVEAVKAALPEARFFVNQVGLGSVASRDRMMREARGDLVLALDDDSYPEQLTLAQTNFDSKEHLTRSFANSGAVLRQSIYLQLPGFESRFYHMYEEPDYGLQCTAAGYDVLFSPVVTIRHRYSGQARDEIRIHHRHSRNEYWSTLMQCPFPFALGMVFWRVVAQFRYACNRGWSWAVREPVWWCHALTGIPYCLRKRRPVSWAAYKRWLSLP